MRKALAGKTIYAATVALAIGLMSTMANAQVTLGDALDFAVLGDAGPVIMGNSATLKGAPAHVGASYNIVIGGNNSSYSGDVISSLFEYGPGRSNQVEQLCPRNREVRHRWRRDSSRQRRYLQRRQSARPSRLPK